jgi:hypothetical protein
MKKILLMLCVLLSLWIFGCGNPENSGTLLVSAPTASKGIVSATATFVPSTGTALPNQAINFRWYTEGVTSKIRSNEIQSTGRTDNNGSVTSQYTLSVNRDESLNVYVIASTGDLTNKEGWQSVQVDP